MTWLQSAVLVLCLTSALALVNYDPDRHNVYHIFTRSNPSQSQPMFLGQSALLRLSNFNGNRRTVFIIHGWSQTADAELNHVLVPAFLRGADMNVVCVDWGIGASIVQGNNGPDNAVASGSSVARGIEWMRAETGLAWNNIMIVGFSLGAHQAAVAGRTVSGTIPYIVALDPGANMEDSGHMFSTNAAAYTEAIHTNAGIMGHGRPLAHSDFYPNGGDLQPGCGANFLCNHYRSYHFFAETLWTVGGFTGRRCGSYAQALLGVCVLPGSLRMGGLTPKTGSSGMFHVETNAESPFNRG